MSWFKSLFSGQSNTVTINGTKYSANKSISINGNIVNIDGNSFVVNEPIINVEIHGDCRDISSDNGDITINGHALRVESKNGNIQVGEPINGDAETKNGNITAKQILGKASTVNGNIRR